MSNSGVTNESGGRQNMFPSETRPYIDESVSYEGYPQNAERSKWQMGYGRLCCAIRCLHNNRSNNTRNFLIYYLLIIHNLYIN